MSYLWFAIRHSNLIKTTNMTTSVNAVRAICIVVCLCSCVLLCLLMATTWRDFVNGAPSLALLFGFQSLAWLATAGAISETASLVDFRLGFMTKFVVVVHAVVVGLTLSSLDLRSHDVALLFSAFTILAHVCAAACVLFVGEEEGELRLLDELMFFNITHTPSVDDRYRPLVGDDSDADLELNGAPSFVGRFPPMMDPRRSVSWDLRETTEQEPSSKVAFSAQTQEFTRHVFDDADQEEVEDLGDVSDWNEDEDDSGLIRRAHEILKPHHVSPGKPLPPHATIFKATVNQWRELGPEDAKYVAYVFDLVSREGVRWMSIKRYGECKALHRKLKKPLASVGGASAPFPETRGAVTKYLATLTGRATTTHENLFVDDRAVAIDDWLSLVLETLNSEHLGDESEEEARSRMSELLLSFFRPLEVLHGSHSDDEIAERAGAALELFCSEPSVA